MIDSASQADTGDGYQGPAPLAQGEGRRDILRRLRRVEGQLRGVMRMIEDGEGCMPVAQQLSAARKALDAVFFRMTVCYLEQELDQEGGLDPLVADKLRTVGTLLGKYA
jgi:CsoR family transcriptional regulator, copper-sensing transcriptional repressor